MKSTLNHRLVTEIQDMFEMDQDLRFSWNNESLKQPIINFGTTTKKTPKHIKKKWGLLNYLVYILDHIHNTHIHRIIEQYGYPTSKLLGKKGLFQFFVLVQHQDSDSELQKQCLEYCNFSPKDRAYLTDRVLINEGKKQRYGTQFQRDTKTQKIVSKPIENLKQVERLRSTIGLMPLKKELQLMNRRFASKSK